MTLAEIFLLLMLVVWWAAGIDAEAKAKAASVEDADLPRLVKSLKERLHELEVENDELHRRVEHLREILGARGKSESELTEAFRDRVAEAKRGHPRCRNENVLVEASVINGTESVRLLQDVASTGPTKWTSGRELTRDEIGSFLAAVRLFYGSRSPECRFDYRLVFGSDSDYRYARQRYEQYFYAAQLRQAGAR